MHPLEAGVGVGVATHQQGRDKEGQEGAEGRADLQLWGLRGRLVGRSVRRAGTREAAHPHIRRIANGVHGEDAVADERGGGVEEEQDEVLAVAEADAVVDPRAVVVHLEDAAGRLSGGREAGEGDGEGRGQRQRRTARSGCRGASCRACTCRRCGRSGDGRRPSSHACSLRRWIAQRGPTAARRRRRPVRGL